MDVTKDEKTMILFTQEQRDMCIGWEWPNGIMYPEPLTNDANGNIRWANGMDLLDHNPPDSPNPYLEPLIAGELPPGFANGLEYFQSLPTMFVTHADYPDPI